MTCGPNSNGSRASTNGKLKSFHNKLASADFFDPACGCGNFLVISLPRTAPARNGSAAATVRAAGHRCSTTSTNSCRVDVDQFYGIEIEEFPAQIAQVALWLMDHQMNLRVAEQFGDILALDSADEIPDIVHGNALRIDWNDVVAAEE